MSLLDQWGSRCALRLAITRPDAGSIKRRSRQVPRGALLELLEQRTLLAVTSISIDAINPTEGVPFGTAASPKQIATFDVNNYIGVDESSEYSALIAWGDGTTSAGLGPVTVTFEARPGQRQRGVFGQQLSHLRRGHDHREPVLTDRHDRRQYRPRNQSVAEWRYPGQRCAALPRFRALINRCDRGWTAHECKPWNLRRRELAGNVFGLRGPGQLG